MKKTALILAAVLLLVSGCDSVVTDEPEPTPQTVTASPAPGDTEPPEITAASFPYAFNTTNIYGNTVTGAALADKELYFIHLWATWCPPCIRDTRASSCSSINL